MWSRRGLIAGIGGGLIASALPAHADDEDHALVWPASATEADTAAAREALAEWTEAYRTGDFEAQWRLTDPAIRRWWGLRRWEKGMTSASRRTGALVDYAITGATAVTAKSLPCTEQGHCFHDDISYIAFVLSSRYARATPPQPEYVAMAWSNEGWRFGGGTFPNRPLGETAVILTEKDEKVYTKTITRVPRGTPS
jgi:hypothetical protein